MLYTTDDLLKMLDVVLLNSEVKLPDNQKALMVAFANYVQQKLQQSYVSGWRDFNVQEPESGQRVVINNSNDGREVIVAWSKKYAHLLNKEYDRWYPLPA